MNAHRIISLGSSSKNNRALKVLKLACFHRDAIAIIVRGCVERVNHARHNAHEKNNQRVIQRLATYLAK